MPAARPSSGIDRHPRRRLDIDTQYRKSRSDSPRVRRALFVLSPDPPITEVEISYLNRIKATVARLIIVLNKIDTLETQDLAKTVTFLRRVLAEKVGICENVPIFSVSAR